MKEKYSSFCIAALSGISTLVAQPVVTYPNGGETFVAGATVNITWSGTTVGTLVGIDYTTDNWATTVWLNASYTNTVSNSYSWQIPNTPSTQCKVGVFNASFQGDISDNFFTISASTDVEDKEAQFESLLNVYPVPATEILHVKNAAGTALDFKLFDIAGREINLVVLNESNGNYSIQRGNMAKGVYTLYINDVETGLTGRKKIVLQ